MSRRLYKRDRIGRFAKVAGSGAKKASSKKAVSKKAVSKKAGPKKSSGKKSGLKKPSGNKKAAAKKPMSPERKRQIAGAVVVGAGVGMMIYANTEGKSRAVNKRMGGGVPRSVMLYHNTPEKNVQGILSSGKLKSQTQNMPRGFQEAGDRNTVWMHNNRRSRDMADVYGTSVIGVKVSRRHLKQEIDLRDLATQMSGGKLENPADLKTWVTADPRHVKVVGLAGQWTNRPKRPQGQRPKDIFALRGMAVHEQLGISFGQEFDRTLYSVTGFKPSRISGTKARPLRSYGSGGRS